jgi:hypothetical protein
MFKLSFARDGWVLGIGKLTVFIAPKWIGLRRSGSVVILGPVGIVWA